MNVIRKINLIFLLTFLGFAVVQDTEAQTPPTIQQLLERLWQILQTNGIVSTSTTTAGPTTTTTRLPIYYNLIQRLKSLLHRITGVTSSTTSTTVETTTSTTGETTTSTTGETTTTTLAETTTVSADDVNCYSSWVRKESYQILLNVVERNKGLLNENIAANQQVIANITIQRAAETNDEVLIGWNEYMPLATGELQFLEEQLAIVETLIANYTTERDLAIAELTNYCGGAENEQPFDWDGFWDTLDERYQTINQTMHIASVVFGDVVPLGAKAAALIAKYKFFEADPFSGLSSNYHTLTEAIGAGNAVVISELQKWYPELTALLDMYKNLVDYAVSIQAGGSSTTVA